MLAVLSSVCYFAFSIRKILHVVFIFYVFKILLKIIYFRFKMVIRKALEIELILHQVGRTMILF